MLLQLLVARIRSLLLLLLGIVNRALCCFSRKRRNSFSDCAEPLMLVSIGAEQTTAGTGGPAGQNRGRRDECDRDWNSWDEAPRTVDEHIEHYRQKLAQQTVVAEAEAAAAKEDPAIDFFQDMTPQIIKQTKVLLRTDEPSAPVPEFGRLAATAGNQVLAVSAALADWSDSEQPDDGGGSVTSAGSGQAGGGTVGWEELDAEQTTHLIREKRREQRAQRQMLQQQQRQSQQQQQQHQQQQPIASRVVSFK